MAKTFYVERVAMIGGGVTYHVWEKCKAWETHSSYSTIQISEKSSHQMGRLGSRSIKNLSAEQFEVCSDRRYRIVTNFYRAQEFLANLLIVKAFPETKDVKNPVDNIDLMLSNVVLPAKTVKVKMSGKRLTVIN